jgi:hypothetical protein
LLDSQVIAARKPQDIMLEKRSYTGSFEAGSAQRGLDAERKTGSKPRID